MIHILWFGNGISGVKALGYGYFKDGYAVVAKSFSVSFGTITIINKEYLMRGFQITLNGSRPNF